MSAHTLLESEEPSAEIDMTKILEIFESSKKRFGNQFVVLNLDIDFSENVAKFEAKGYDTYTVEETYEEKLKRIRHELEELKAIRDSEESLKVQPKEDLDLKELDSLLALLGCTDGYDVVQVEPLNMEIYQSVKEVESKHETDSVSPEEVKELEGRIYNLERLTGFGDLNKVEPETGASFQTIESIVMDLNMKFDLLIDLDTEGHSKGVSQQDLVGNKAALASILEKMEKINREITLNNKKLAANQSFFLNGTLVPQPEPLDSGTPEKVEKLYDAFFRDKAENPINIPNITSLLKRMNSLNHLYREYQDTMDLSRNSKKIISNIQQDFSSWQETLMDINSKLVDLSKELAENKKQVDTWIGQIQAKMEDLNS